MQMPPNVPVATRPYRPIHTRSRFAIYALAAVGLAGILALVALSGRLSIVGRLINGELVTAGEANDSDNAARSTAWIEVTAVVVCGVLFLMWLHRTVANNWALGARSLQFSPRSAVGWWFCPIANWVLPFRILRETWRAADPSTPGSTPDRRQLVRTPVYLIVWALCWFVASPINFYVYFTARNPSDTADNPSQILDTLHTQTIAGLGGAVASVVGAVLAAVIVSRVTDRQERLMSVVSQTPVPAPAVASA